MRTRLLASVVAIALATTVAACSGDDDQDSTGSTGSSTTEAPVGTELDGREFVSSDVAPSDGTEPVKGSPVRLQFSDGSVGANAGCNSMSGPYTLDGDTLVIGTLAQTEMACSDALMAQDDWLAGLLTGRPTATLDGDTLVLEGDTGRIELIDADTAEPDSGLVGTTWVLDTIATGDVASSVPTGVNSTITFTEDGTALLDTGCNRGSADYEVDGDTITFGPAGTTRMACDEPAAEVESAYLATISGETTFTIDGGRLTVNGNGRGLSFTANGPAEGGPAEGGPADDTTDDTANDTANDTTDDTAIPGPRPEAP